MNPTDVHDKGSLQRFAASASYAGPDCGTLGSPTAGVQPYTERLQMRVLVTASPDARPRDLHRCVAITRRLSGEDLLAEPFSWDWFNPFTGLTVSAFVAGRLGVDLRVLGLGHRLTVNEEIQGRRQDARPGGDLLCVVSILLTYLLVSIAAMMYAGVGTEGLGLGNEEISDNVFGALAEPVMGSGRGTAVVPGGAGLTVASLMTTFLPTTRTHARDGRLQALPKRFATIHPSFLTPGYGTVVAGGHRRGRSTRC